MSMICPNINSKEYKQMEAVLGSEMAQHVWRVSQEMLASKNGMVQSPRLDQVKELFESNPELANKVYEALGVKNDKASLDTWLEYVSEKDGITKEEASQRIIDNNTKMITVYRGEGSTIDLADTNLPEHVKKSKGRWFTKDKEVAKAYAIQQKGELYAVMIPEALFDNISKELKLKETNGVEALLPKELALKKQKISDITPQQKQKAQQLYSEFLESLSKPNTNPILQGNRQEQVKKFAELQERLSNKEFLEGAKNAYESTPALQEFGTQEQYNDYIARVSLGIVKNPSSGEYNYTSKVTDIVYHGSGVNTIAKEGWKTGKETGTGHRGVLGYYFTKYLLDAKIYAQRAGSPKGTPGSLLQQGFIVPVILNSGAKTTETEIYDRFAEIRRWDENYEGFDTVTFGQGLDENKEIVVKTKEQIHILGSKQDIDGFKEFVQEEGVNEVEQGSTEAPSLYDEYVSEYGPHEGIKRFANHTLGLPEDSGLDQRNDYTLKVNQVLENRKNARAVDVLVSAIERAMPGVRVHRETNQSMREKGQDPNQSGFVDSDGYHLNLDRITTRTPIHELSHVFMAIIKVENRKLYDRMMQQLDDMIQDSPVFEAMRRKYPNKSMEQLKDEYMAQLAGFYSAKHIQAFIEAQNLQVHSTSTENEYGRTRGLFRTIWDNIRGIMNRIMGWGIERDNMENMAIQQIFELLTVKAMSGQPIPYMNGDKMEIIKDAFYDIQANFSDDKIDDDIYLRMEEQKEVKYVRSVKDIPHILINNSDPGAFAGSAEYWEGNKDVFADNIMRRLYQPKGSNKIYVEWMGKRYEFEAGSTEDTLRNLITEQVLRDHVKRITSIPSSVMKTVERYYGNPVGDESIESIIKQEFSDGQDRMTVQIPEIMRLMNLIGAEDNVVAVMALSDFMNSEYSKDFRMLDTSIIGNNPVVIVHEATPGTIDISISDINTGDLSFNGVYTNNQRKLGARFMQDYQNPITQNAWTNSKMDTQAAALVTTIAGLRHIAQKSGIQINIRRAGVYGIRGGSSGAINAKAIFDFKDAFHQVRSVMQMDGMQALLQNNFLKDVIADDKAWDAESLDTNVLHQLESFYTNEKIYDNLSQGMIGYIVGTKGTKLEQEDAIRRRMSYLINHRTAGDVHSGAEYQLLAKAYLYVKRGWTMGTMNFDDMTSVGKQILNGHNIGNSLAQYAILEMETAKSMVVAKADAFGKEFNKHVENIRKVREIKGTDPKEIFGRLHPEVEVIVDRKYEKTSEHEELNEGDRIKVQLNNEIYSNSYPDKELIQRMLDSNQITEEELAFGDFLLEKIREIYIDDMYTRGKAHNMDYTLEMAEDEFDKNYTPGTIPVLPATNMELFRMGHMKTWTDNMLTLMSRGDLQYGDMSTKEFGDITSRFRMQLHSSAQLDAMGLRKVTDPVTGVTEYRSIDLDKAFLQSKNLEYTLKFFQLDMTRTKIFNKYIVPLKHDVYAIAAIVKSGTGNGLEGTLSWFNEYYKLIVERQHKDHNSKNKFEAIASPTVRSVVQLNTFINIGFRPVIWLKSAYFNEQSSLIAALANTAANMGSVTERWNFPTVKETLKAHKLLFTDLKKVWRLAEKFQLINGTERDVLQNIAKISTDKHMFRQQIAHLGNHYGDAAARTMSMVAFLLHDGSYDAYEYNEQTDEITYDVKKDRRLFNEDGTYKEGMDVVHKAIILEQERQGLYTGKQEIGYDFEEINNRMKWYSDKFIIGSMDNHQKTLFGNQYMGAALGQFRTFMWDKLWNFGWGRITTEYGGSFVPVKNDKGEYIAVRQQQEIAGMINSFGQTFKHLKKVLNKDASFWVDMAPVDRRNMADFGIRAMLLGLMVSLFALATDDDDDEETRKEKQRFIAEIMRRDPNMSRDEALEQWRKHKGYALSATDRQKLEFLWQDIFVWDTITNFYDNPIPALRVIGDIYELAVGRDRLKRIIRYVGPANDAVWLYSLFTKHDDPFKGDLSNNERKKLQEEKELEKEYKEMQDRLSSADIDWSKYTDF